MDAEQVRLLDDHAKLVSNIEPSSEARVTARQSIISQQVSRHFKTPIFPHDHIHVPNTIIPRRLTRWFDNTHELCVII